MDKIVAVQTWPEFNQTMVVQSASGYSIFARQLPWSVELRMIGDGNVHKEVLECKIPEQFEDAKWWLHELIGLPWFDTNQSVPTLEKALSDLVNQIQKEAVGQFDKAELLSMAEDINHLTHQSHIARLLKLPTEPDPIWYIMNFHYQSVTQIIMPYSDLPERIFRMPIPDLISDIRFQYTKKR
jgi:hypothetical protein